jgi:CHAT domain-containing protein
VFAGPGLDGALEEVALIRGLSATDDGEPLLGRAADMAGVLAQHAVVHLACHGRFVADNPLLSSLELDDGRWYAHDVELAARCPSVVVLSACSVALAAPQPGDELLGFVASLLGAGTRTVVASSVPVPDAAGSAEAMVELHRQLGAGGGAAAALRAVRRRWPVLGAAYGVHGAGR